MIRPLFAASCKNNVIQPDANDNFQSCTSWHLALWKAEQQTEVNGGIVLVFQSHVYKISVKQRPVGGLDRSLFSSSYLSSSKTSVLRVKTSHCSQIPARRDSSVQVCNTCTSSFLHACLWLCACLCHGHKL